MVPGHACRQSANWHLLVRQVRLYLADGRGEHSRCEQPRPQRPGGVLPQWRQTQQGDAHLFGHVPELPPDLVASGGLVVGRGKSGGLRGVSSGSQSMRAHVRDTRGLPGGVGCRHGSWRLRRPTCAARFKTAPNLPRRVEFTGAEASGTVDAISRTIIAWGVGLEQWEDSLGAVCGP